MKGVRIVQSERREQRRLLQARPLRKHRRFLFFSSSVLIVSISWGLLSNKELDAALLAARRRLQKQGDVVKFKNFLVKKVQKPVGSRMGKGKGTKVKGLVCPVVPGDVVFGIWSESSIDLSFLKGAALDAVGKLSVKCRLVYV